MNTETTMQTQRNDQRVTAKKTASAPDAGAVTTPPVDVLEGPLGFRVIVDLPGVRTEGLSLDVEKGVLTLTARRDGGPRPLTYKRSFLVPRDTDLDKIEATLDAGVLTLSLPKSEATRPRVIQVTRPGA